MWPTRKSCTFYDVCFEHRTPDKRSTTSNINRLLKKFRDTGTVDRRRSSDRPRYARTDENIDQLNDMILIQKDQLRTNRTVREISQEIGIPLICCPHRTKRSAVEVLPKSQQIWTSNFPR